MAENNSFTWSLAGVTDAALFRYMGNSHVLNSYAVFSCPQNPFYRWGNRIHFGYNQTYNDSSFCEKLMIQEFEQIAGITHHAFSWDVESYAQFPTEAWEALGYGVDYSDTLVLTQQPNALDARPQDISIRKLTSDLDWQQAQDCQVLVRSKYWNEKDFRAYLTPKFSAYRQIAQEEQGVWLGAFTSEGIQVGNLGMLYCKPEAASAQLLVRFQMVATHPDFQRRGICQYLLQEAIKYLFQYAEQKQFSSVSAVIVADPDYHAKKLYQKVGFVSQEYQVIVTKQTGK